MLLLGAGFSTPWGYPVMRDFTNAARRRQIQLSRDRPNDPLVGHHDKLFEFQKECRLGSWAFNRDWDNIEELYSQADLRRLSAVLPDATDKADELCKSIAWSIWDTYRGAEQAVRRDSATHDALPLVPRIGSFVKLIHQQDLKLVAITTNYDTLLEHACSEPPSGVDPIPTVYPGFGRPVENMPFMVPSLENSAMFPVPQINSLPIVKLHGSVNWFSYLSQGDFGCVASTEYSAKRFTNSSIDGPSFDPAVLMAGIKKFVGHDAKSAVPLIVPPMLGKLAFDPLLRVQWRSAIQYLRNAVHLVIVGYSFPETDVFMPRLLSEGLSENLMLEQIAIVNTDRREDWKARIDRIFSPTVRDSKVVYYRASSVDFCHDMNTVELLKKTGAVPAGARLS